MTKAPRLASDPFDEKINALLADPAFVAELDRRHADVTSGEATLHTGEEVQARLRKLRVPLPNDVSSGE